MIFKTMDPELVLKALEGQPNVLRPVAEDLERYFKGLRCPNCKGEMMPFIDPERELFLANDPLPNFMARCKTCRAEFEPYTLIQTSLPR